MHVELVGNYLDKLNFIVTSSGVEMLLLGPFDSAQGDKKGCEVEPVETLIEAGFKSSIFQQAQYDNL